MLKELLSNFLKVTQPSYHPDTFQPYLSMILTIVVVTFFAYGFQITTSNLYTLANNPAALKNKIQTKLCGDFTHASLLYICKGVQTNEVNYNANSLLSFEQDVHKRIN